MFIKSFTVGPVATNCYLVADETTKKGVIIDPGDQGERIAQFAKESGYDFEKILLTHGHFDHIGGVAAVKAATGAKVVISAEDAPMLTSSRKSLAAFSFLSQAPAQADILVQDGDTVTLLSDVDLGEAYVTISKSITFDLNGKTLSSSKAWLRYGVLLVKDATVTVKNGTVKAAGDGSCAIRAYRSGSIMTYYAVIGGWITKYAVVYLTGQSAAAAEDGYFTSFITSPVSPVVFALLFMGVTAFIVYNGVEGGIERVSRYMMPILLVLVVVIAGYALTLRHEDASGQMRTGMEGLRYYLTPHMEGLTVSRFLQILLDAMSQLFFSLSVSMGIMITYGSYVKPDVDLNKAVNQIEIFDTGVALLAGAMIIPAVYVFSGTEGMSAGPSLMFVSLPKVFAAMGKAGTFVGILFFVTAIFATLTSCISVLESITANCMEIFHSGRKKTVLVLTVIYLAASAIIALGYSIFYFEVQLPNGSAAQLLDIMDYVSNSVMMPFIALLSTILIGWVMTPDYIIDEMQRNGETFRRKKLYRVMIRYVAPVMMLVLFLQSTGILA